MPCTGRSCLRVVVSAKGKNDEIECALIRGKRAPRGEGETKRRTYGAVAVRTVGFSDHEDIIRFNRLFYGSAERQSSQRRRGSALRRGGLTVALD